MVAEIFMFESVNARTEGRTDGRTPARLPSYKLTLWAYGSGELKMKVLVFKTLYIDNQTLKGR